MKHREITEKIFRGFYTVYNNFGTGFLESVYENSLLIKLQNSGLKAHSQMPLSVYYREQVVGEFKADILVNDAVLLELKAVKRIEEVHKAQLINYLKVTGLEIGLILNFGNKPDFKRIIFTK